MKKNQLAEIKKLDIKPLQDKVTDMRGEVAKLELDNAMNKLKNFKEVKNLKRNLAQLLTIIRQKELLKQLEEQHAKN